MEMKLSKENYQKGFLIDDEWMGGVSVEAETGRSTAFVLDHQLAETLYSETFETLDLALHALNSLPRTSWKFESSNGCDSDDCQKGGCKGESCKIFSECGGSRC
jgi:hypothetical protein